MPRGRKRANGEGTLYQRKDGKWIGAFTSNGRRRAVSGRTRAEAGHKLRDAMEAADAGRLPDPSRITVGEYLDQWLENTAKPKVRPLSYQGYRTNIRRHIQPTIGHIRLNRLEPQHVQAMLNQKLGEGLNGKTVSYIRQVLRTALDQAERWNLVARNVASLVPAPRKVRKPIRPLQADEIPLFVEAITGSRLEALYLTTLALGLRQGEVLGLQWQDVDFQASQLRIQRQLQRTSEGVSFPEPKSERGRRVIDMPQIIGKALAEHKRRQWLEKLVAGSRWQENNLVFSTTIGTPLHPRSLIADFHDVLRRSGLPRVRFHDLRHSAATLMLVQGVPPRVVMEILGHSEIRLTLETYSHVIPGLRREAADRMDATLRSAKDLSGARAREENVRDPDDL